MNYIEYKIAFNDNCNYDASEIAMAMLCDIGFDSFEDNTSELLAYITEANHAEFESDIAQYAKELTAKGYSVEINKIESVNWNKEWESNFEPINIDDICQIRAPFHALNSEVKYDIVIMPKMSFGTGHHATTHLMTKTIFTLPIEGKKGLDMGSGTGVLAIAALLSGASYMSAVDIDDWAYENCIENLETNNLTSKCKVMLGDASAIEGMNFDFILANINRNILIADMPKYVATLNEGGHLVVSGFLEIDLKDIESKAQSLGLQYVSHQQKDGWIAAVFSK
ncbi:MAG: 50S ribosomal protein L11 methyltransferase [Rikenellaceae bacterium]